MNEVYRLYSSISSGKLTRMSAFPITSLPKLPPLAGYIVRGNECLALCCVCCNMVYLHFSARLLRLQQARAFIYTLHGTTNALQFLSNHSALQIKILTFSICWYFEPCSLLRPHHKHLLSLFYL